MFRGLSSLDIVAIVDELQQLIGGYLENIYQRANNEVILRISTKKTAKKEILFIRNGELICLTEQSFDVPQKPPVFAMTLRKYLKNGRITEITQQGFDRVIAVKIGKKEGDYSIIVELFTNGNIILLDPNHNILLPLVKQRWTHRLIQPHEVYTPPPTQMDPFQLNQESFTQLLRKSTKDLVRTLALQINLGGAYAEELLLRTGFDKHVKPYEMDDASLQHLYHEFQVLLTIFKEKQFHPMIIKKDEQLVDIIPFPFKKYESFEKHSVHSFVHSLDVLIDAKPSVSKKEVKQQQKHETLLRKLEKQQASSEEFKKKIVELKHLGDLLFLNAHTIQPLLDQITMVLKQKNKTKGIQTILDNSFVKQFDPETNTLTIMLTNSHGTLVETAIDFRKTTVENAEAAYTESKKYQEKLNGALEAISETHQQIQTVEQQIEQQTIQPPHPQQPHKLFWFERFHWFISSQGNIIVGGKDAKTNEVVVKKYLTEGDRYVHADVHGAPSCIIKNQDSSGNILEIAEQTLSEACIFAASFSKAWGQFAQAQAYWVLPEQVSKTPQSGEFLPKGAFVIRGKRNYQQCTLLLAVGKIRLEDQERIMCGPVDSVKTYSSQYVVISPGETKKSEVAKKIAHLFQVSVDAIERVLPSGSSTITQTIGFSSG